MVNVKTRSIANNNISFIREIVIFKKKKKRTANDITKSFKINFAYASSIDILDFLR